MIPGNKGVLIAAGLVLMLIGGKRPIVWMARYMVSVTRPLVGHQWHGFPKVHRIKEITWMVEQFTGETIEVFGCGIRAEPVRKKTKRVSCNICGETIREEPIGEFIYSPRGEERRIV